MLRRRLLISCMSKARANMADVLVLGGGLSGLAAAHHLISKAPGITVKVIEASARVGGIVGTDYSEKDFVIEQGPDCFITDKPWALALSKRLGLESEIIGTNEAGRGSYVVCDGKLERIPEGFSLLAPTQFRPIMMSPILSWRGKARLAMEMILPRGAARADESLESFATRRFGKEAYERLSQPLVGGIYGADPTRLSLRATMPRFLNAETESRSVTLHLRKQLQNKKSEHASGARYGLFASFKRGMQVLPDALAQALGDRILLNAEVSALQTSDRGYVVTLTDGREFRGDAVIAALPPRAQPTALQQLDAELAKELQTMTLGSAALVTFAFQKSDIEHKLDAFGFVVPNREKRLILASTWASEKWAGRAPSDIALIRVFLGGPSATSLLNADTATHIEVAMSELKALMGVRGRPLFVRTGRLQDSMPQYLLGHAEHIARVEKRIADLPRFALASNGLHGVGLPDTIHSGERAAERILMQLGVAA